MGESFWQKNTLVTPILFELHMSIMIFSPGANCGHHPLVAIYIFWDMSLLANTVQNSTWNITLKCYGMLSCTSMGLYCNI